MPIPALEYKKDGFFLTIGLERYARREARGPLVRREKTRIFRVSRKSHSPFSPSFQTFPFDRSRAGSQPRQKYGQPRQRKRCEWCATRPYIGSLII